MIISIDDLAAMEETVDVLSSLSAELDTAAAEIDSGQWDNTPNPVSALLVSTNATVNNAPAQQIFDEAVLPTQDIAPGQQLAVPFRFKVPAGTTGPLQIAVTDTFNEPVFFTGRLG